MSGRQVLDVDVVADAGAVRRRIVGAEDRDVRPLAHRRLAGDLDEQRRIRGGLADAAAGVGPRHVEVAQGHIASAGEARATSRSIHSDMSLEVP